VLRSVETECSLEESDGAQGSSEHLAMMETTTEAMAVQPDALLRTTLIPQGTSLVGYVPQGTTPHLVIAMSGVEMEGEQTIPTSTCPEELSSV
jgi:hypothetical protein